MGTNFFSYLERLELMGFFVAYPLLYLLIKTITEDSKNEKIKNLSRLLPFSYALVGTLYLGLQLKNLYPDYSFENIKHMTEEPVLKIWGLLSMLFWIPALAKKPVFSFWHSLVFFILLTRDLFLHLVDSVDKSVVQNDMSIYTNSLLVNISSFLFIILLSAFIAYSKKR